MSRGSRCDFQVSATLCELLGLASLQQCGGMVNCDDFLCQVCTIVVWGSCFLVWIWCGMMRGT